MNYQDVEYKLSQYAQWCGNPVKSLDYPRRSIYAKAIPDELDPNALPDMGDDEAQVVGDALLALKAHHPERFRVVEARFMQNMNDDEIGRAYRLGTRRTVYSLRMGAYLFLQGRMSL